jgi:ubiquinone/menaquinone biosynthesis C-methylase UbiE
MQEAYRKDLTHLTWAEVYARQLTRAPLVGDWLDGLRVKTGDRVLDVGSGPGYVSLVLAERVGNTGIVYAVDRSAEALAYLERLQTERKVSNIERVVGDAATLDLTGFRADSALIAMVLHHADDPAGLLRNVAHSVRPGALAVVAEFHPQGPCDQGPPRPDRLNSRQVRTWCEAAGLSTLGERRQTPEHYMLVLQRFP